MLLLAMRMFADIEVRFDSSLRMTLMLAFFATIGLNANFASLKKGGRVLGGLLVVTALLVVQNAMGIALANALGFVLWRVPLRCQAGMGRSLVCCSSGSGSPAWSRYNRVGQKVLSSRIKSA